MNIGDEMSKINILAVGDINLKNKFGNSAFGNVQNILKKADISFANLETVITQSDFPISNKAVVIKTSKDIAKINLNKELFDVVNIGNNHIFDFYERGLIDTLNYLEENNIEYIGIANSEKKSFATSDFHINGISVIFVGAATMEHKNYANYYVPTVNNELLEFIRTSAKKYDYVIVSMHWGTELTISVSKEQEQLGKELINAGASVILGHHPHVVQGFEKYKNGLIFYSLGNFNFDINGINENSKISMILELVLSNKGIDYKFIPIILDKDGTPDFDKYNKVEEIINISSYFIKNASKWFYYFDAYDVHLRGNILAWKKRIFRPFNFFEMLRFIRWLIQVETCGMFLAGILDRMFKVKEKMYNGKAFKDSEK